MAPLTLVVLAAHLLCASFPIGKDVSVVCIVWGACGLYSKANVASLQQLLLADALQCYQVCPSTYSRRIYSSKVQLTLLNHLMGTQALSDNV